MTSKYRLGVLVLGSALAGSGQAYEFYNHGGFKLQGSLQAMAGFRHGENINFGMGAASGFFDLRSTGEQTRDDLQLALKPRVDLEYAMGGSTLYGGGAGVASTTTLDGELSGQFARSGDEAFNVDSAYVGWKNDWLDLSYGAREFTIGDGFIVGDGNFNQGHDNGQYWTGAFTAWRNTGVAKVNTNPVRADFYWLRTDNDLGDSRVAGLNFENSDKSVFGQLGLMYFEVFDDNGLNGFKGTQVVGVRGHGLHWPGRPALSFFGEYVHQMGEVKQNLFYRPGAEVDADAWYAEVNYEFTAARWKPRLQYRYAQFSGDDVATPQLEEYRGMFFTIFKRDWDTWYMGEIAGEFFLFNENQQTHMAKVKAFPSPRTAVGFWYYHHALDTPQYFGIPTGGATEWTDEINLSFEYFPNDRLYWYVGAAWATPLAAARRVFGPKDQTVVQTFLSYTFK